MPLTIKVQGQDVMVVKEFVYLLGHIMRMDDNADAKRILLASPLADWGRQLGRPRITWLSTIQQDLNQHHLTLPEAADLAQNRPLWRMMSTYGDVCNPELHTRNDDACTKCKVSFKRWQYPYVCLFDFLSFRSSSV